MTHADFSVAGRTVAVIGAARSGIAAAELLARRGARVTLSDTRADIGAAHRRRLESAGVSLELGGHITQTFTGADLVVASPGVPPGVGPLAAARAAGVPVIGEMELASRWLSGRVIAITGTKGKSTTTTLTGRILEHAGFLVTVGGNIGLPLSDQVDRSTPQTLHVVEASSFQLEQIVTFRPWVAVMLNFSPDHLDRHDTIEAYAAAKARVFENQQADDWAVVNGDDAGAMRLAANTRAQRHQFSRAGRMANGVVVEDGWVTERSPERSRRILPLSCIRLLGPHLIDDVLAATAVSLLAGAEPQAVAAAVEGFSGLEHAMELVGERAGVRFVNDSKATNVESAVRSVESFTRGVVAIIGGHYKGGDLSLLREPLRTRGTAVVAIGEAASLVRAALENVVPVTTADSMDDAVTKAFALARPACASFDMFRDYAERGRAFKAAASRLVQHART